MLAALDVQFSLHAHVLLSRVRVPLWGIPPLSSPQVAWEQSGYGSLTLLC